MADFPSLLLSPSPRPPSFSYGQTQRTLSSFVGPHTSYQGSRLGVKGLDVGGPVRNVRGKKRKLAGRSSSAAKRHRTLKTFFKISPDINVNSASSETGSDVTTIPPSQCSPVATRELTPEPFSSSQCDSEPLPSSSQLSSEWVGVFSGPPKPPLCTRHMEPATLRTVRKTGPNRGRQFWVCSRPGGSKIDTTTQCDFFQWLTAKH